VRTRPYTVLLFDEIEKAHSDVVNVLLQLLDEGRLTDGQGRTIDFRNTLVIMTSNLGTDLLAGAHTEEERKRVVEGALRSFFRPEFLNRLDDIVLFHPLTEEQLAQVEARLKERRIHLKVSEEARRLLAREGFDPAYGARPLKRTIQRRVVDPLTMQILGGTVRDGQTVAVRVVSGNLEIAPSKGGPAKEG